MHRFFVENLENEKKIFIIKEKNFYNQITKVLRLKKQEKIILFNGKNNFDYIYEISEINKKNIILIFLEKQEKIIKENFEINLFQALANKISKIELILQKGVEVGINNFYFFYGERSQKFFISDNKKERLKKIIIEAVEQSGQNKIPKIFFLDNIKQAINISSDFNKKLNLFFHTENNKSKLLKEIQTKNYKNINIFVGPEGGFSKNEINIFLENKFKQVFLGNNILRTETLAIVVGFFLKQINL